MNIIMHNNHNMEITIFDVRIFTRQCGEIPFTVHVEFEDGYVKSWNNIERIEKIYT